MLEKNTAMVKIEEKDDEYLFSDDLNMKTNRGPQMIFNSSHNAFKD